MSSGPSFPHFTPPDDRPNPTALNQDSTYSPDPIYDPRDNPMADSYKSAELGGVGDELHDAVVRSVYNQEMYLRQLLGPLFQKMTGWWKLYFSQKEDLRKEGEEWRANVVVPYAYSGVRTMVAAVSDIINSSDPVIQPDAILSENEEDSRAISRILDYTLNKNYWRRTLDKGLTDAGVQGMWLPKLVYGKRSQRVYIVPNAADLDYFNKALHDAEQQGASPSPDPWGDPQAFEVWRQMANAAKKGKIPEAPVPGWQDIVEYAGPQIVHDPIWQYRFDPFIDDIQDQDIVIHRVVKTREWVLQHTGKGEDKPYDEDQVMKALNHAVDRQRFSEWQDQIAVMMGLSGGASDPRYLTACELWEVWRKDAQHPYMVILNRHAIISKPDKRKCHSNPFWHGCYPFFPIRNIPVPGYMNGISEIAPNEPLYHEMNSLRDLRLDAVTLRVLPVFMRLAEVGMPELAHLLQPGMVLPTSRPDGIKNLMEGGMDGVMAAFREIDYIKQDIDETNSTPPSLRGGQATVGRVSATESERRFNQALVRQKQRVQCIEDELQPFTRMSLFLWYQFANTGDRVRVGGTGQDPFVTIRKSMFQEALDMNFRFRGASKALNRDMLTQQLQGFAKEFMQTMTLTEIRALMRRVYETMGLKGADEIVSEEGTKQLTQAQEAQKQQSGAVPKEAINFKDLPPDGQVQMAKQAGIEIQTPLPPAVPPGGPQGQSGNASPGAGQASPAPGGTGGDSSQNVVTGDAANAMIASMGQQAG